MDNPVIIIDAPELSDEGVASVMAFLHEIILAFESHYMHQLNKHHCRSKRPWEKSGEDEEEDLDED